MFQTVFQTAHVNPTIFVKKLNVLSTKPPNSDTDVSQPPRTAMTTNSAQWILVMQKPVCANTYGAHNAVLTETVFLAREPSTALNGDKKRNSMRNARFLFATPKREFASLSQRKPQRDANLIARNLESNANQDTNANNPFVPMMLTEDSNALTRREAVTTTTLALLIPATKKRDASTNQSKTRNVVLEENARNANTNKTASSGERNSLWETNAKKLSAMEVCVKLF